MTSGAVVERALACSMCVLLCVAASLFGSRASGAAAELPQLDIPYTRHRLSNGLTLIVHEDPKATQVSVDISYRVGSGDEPVGRSGISHLFEHLMFRGSEHYNHDWFETLQPLGASPATANGTAYVDRTHYFETVPSGALDTILWLESDRMGYLPGGIDQAKLDEQRGIVHNERRAIENTPWDKIGNNPYGPNAARILAAIWPPGHPYSRLYIGTEQDLDAVTLEGLREWFKTWYAPSNAVLVLAGNVTAAAAVEKVERYFGAIPPGPSMTRVKRWATMPRGPRRDIVYDSQLATAALTRTWSIPEAGVGSADADYLELLAAVLNRQTSHLSRRLIVEEKVASDVSVNLRKNEIGSQLTIRLTALAGVDLEYAERILQEELARVLKQGPAPDELQAVRMEQVARMVSSIQSTAFKASLLGIHELFLGDAGAWRNSFERFKLAEPADVVAAARRWLSDGDYVLAVVPRAQLTASTQDVDRRSGPPPVRVAPVKAPKFVRTSLANGAQVMFAERHDAPEVTVNLLIPTGVPADAASWPPGVAELAMSLANEGTTKQGGTELSQALARLGASVEARGDDDVVQVSLRTLSATLPQTLELFADVLLRPAFLEADVERIKARQLALIANVRSNPISAADRIGPRLLFGPDHPYARLQDRRIEAISRADLVRFQSTWMRPERATFVVVGDATLPELKARLDDVLASWRGGSPPKIAQPRMPVPRKPAVWLIDAPGASQSSIQLLLPTAAPTADRESALQLLTRLVGLRLNKNLRGDKHWTYGVSSALARRTGPRAWRIQTLVQTDKTAAALTEVRREVARVVGEPPVESQILTGIQQEQVRGLADSWETHQEVAAALRDMVFYSWPDDYLQNYARRIEQVTPRQVHQAAAELAINQGETWIVAGDLSKVEQSVRALNIGEVTIIDADGRILR